MLRPLQLLHGAKPHSLNPIRIQCRHRVNAAAKARALVNPKAQLYKKAGPLYKLIDSDLKNDEKPNSKGNVLHCLTRFDQENSFLKNEELNSTLSWLKYKLIESQRISNSDFNKLRKIINKNDLSQGKIYNELLFSLCVYMAETNNGIIDIKNLELISSYVVNTKDFKLLTNYQIMIEKLHDLNYFENLNPKIIYKIVYSPMIKSMSREQYIMKINNLRNGIEFINEYKHENFYNDLLNSLRNDLIESLQLAIDLDDALIIKELWTFLISNYEKISIDHFHDLKKILIEQDNSKMLAALLQISISNIKSGIPELSIKDRNLISLVFLQNNDYENFIKYFKPISNFSLFERSLILEGFTKELSLSETLKLIGELTNEDDTLCLKDFQFLIKKIINGLPIERKYTFITVENSIHQHFLTNDEVPSRIKSLYMNSFLRALSSKTNISGVIHAYGQFPLELVNNETYQILFHILSSNPQQCIKRTIELFKFSRNILGFKFSNNEYNILIRNSITKEGHINLNQVLYFLYHYLKSSGESYIPISISRILETIDVEKNLRTMNFDSINPEILLKNHIGLISLLIHSNDENYHMTPLEIVEIIIPRVGSIALSKEPINNESGRFRPIEEFFIMDYEPSSKEFNHYDHIDSKKLKVKHLAYIESLKEKDPVKFKKLKNRQERLTKEIELLDNQFGEKNENGPILLGEEDFL